MLAIILPKGDDKVLGALLFQQCKDFKVYLPEDDPLTADYEGKLPIVHGVWQNAAEPLSCILESGALPDPKFVKRVLRTVRRHPDFDVYHVNLRDGKAFPCKCSTRKLFQLAILQGQSAPLSSFIFRSARLREKAVYKADGSLEVLPTVLSCAQNRPIRNVWLQKLDWNAPAATKDPAGEVAAIQQQIDLYRWTETFFGDDDYPLSVGDQLKLFAQEVAKLYPSYSPEELKEIMNNFQVSQGAVRKLRASNALKSAIKERQKTLQ